MCQGASYLLVGRKPKGKHGRTGRGDFRGEFLKSYAFLSGEFSAPEISLINRGKLQSSLITSGKIISGRWKGER